MDSRSPPSRGQASREQRRFAIAVIPAKAGIHDFGQPAPRSAPYAIARNVRAGGRATLSRIRDRSTSLRGISKAKSLDSRLRGNDGRGRSGSRRADYHSRLRGNDEQALVLLFPRSLSPRWRGAGPRRALSEHGCPIASAGALASLGDSRVPRPWPARLARRSILVARSTSDGLRRHDGMRRKGGVRSPTRCRNNGPPT